MLQTDGTLLGAVVDTEGRARPGVAVSLVSQMYDRKEIAKIRTDKLGRFAFRGLRGGVYQVLTAEGS